LSGAVPGGKEKRERRSEVKLTDWEKVGTFCVDAGLAWIGDPCYLSNGNGPMEYWDKFCQHLSDVDDEVGKTSSVYTFDDGLAVQSGWGDGEYNVYVKREPGSSRPLGVLIVFDEAVAEEQGLVTDEEEEL